MKTEKTRDEKDCIKPLVKTAVKALRDMFQFGVRACDETLKILGEKPD